MKEGIKAGIMGVSGYVGQELVRILHEHPEIGSIRLAGRTSYNEFYQLFQNHYKANNYQVQKLSLEELAMECDVLFVALPHGVLSKEINERILNQTIVIDLGADFRLSSQTEYESWYQTPHGSPDLLKRSVYGLVELNRNKIQQAKFIGNPGCYTTCSILSIVPFLKGGFVEPDGIIIDAKSGVSGAGRGISLDGLYTETNENLKAYKVFGHRHIPEIEEYVSEFSETSIQPITFTPHLVPMNRGILTTTYLKLNKGYQHEKLAQYLEEFYQEDPFIRVLPEGRLAETKWVKGTNYVDISFYLDARTNRLTVVSVLDNLIKGAAGQAIQNMNIIFGLKESQGISNIAIYP